MFKNTIERLQVLLTATDEVEKELIESCIESIFNYKKLENKKDRIYSLTPGNASSKADMLALVNIAEEKEEIKNSVTIAMFGALTSKNIVNRISKSHDLGEIFHGSDLRDVVEELTASTTTEDLKLQLAM